MSYHLFLDLEALDTRPTAAIVELGAVFFDPATGEIGETFQAMIVPHPACSIGADTLAWHQAAGTWPQPECEACELSDALEGFREFVNLHPVEAIWSWGSTYDFPILDHAFRVAGDPQAPWKYWQCQCARTVYKVAFGPEKRPAPRPHAALEDCRAGICDLVAALNALRAATEQEESAA